MARLVVPSRTLVSFGSSSAHCQLDRHRATSREVAGAALNIYRTILVCLVAFALASCASKPKLGNAATGEAADDAIPPNYREQIVKTIRTWTAFPIRSAYISEPTRLFMGLMSGGYRKSICVDVQQDIGLQGPFTEHWQFSFNNGEILIGARSYAYRCPDRLPFNELLRQN